MGSSSSTDVGVILPAVERFDGRGGAVATWVKETYAHSTFQPLVASPRRDPRYAGSLQVSPTRSYDAFERVVALAAHSAAKLYGKTTLGAYRKLLGDDRWWVGSALRRLQHVPVLHVHNRPKYPALIRRLGYEGKILLHMHNDLSDYVDASEVAQMATSTDVVAFCSEYARSQAHTAFATLPPTHVVPNGVKTEHIQHARPLFSAKALKLVFVGRIIPEKGALEAVKICEELCARGYHVSMEMLGGTGPGGNNDSTPYLRAVQAAVRGLNRSRELPIVTMHGPRPHTEVFEALGRADALLLPCRWAEPFGMVALEAMAKGAVPIVSARGGLPEVIAGAGIAIDAPDDQLVVTFVREIVDAVETGRINDLRIRCAERAHDLTWDKVADRLDRVLNALMPRERSTT